MIEEQEMPYNEVSHTQRHWYPKWIILTTEDPPILPKRTAIGTDVCTTELITSKRCLPVARQHEAIAEEMNQVKLSYDPRWSKEFLQMLADPQEYQDGWLDFLLYVACDTARHLHHPLRSGE